LKPGGSVSGGQDEVVDEFLNQTSDRAKEYMKGFMPQLSGLTIDQKRAAISSKLIELSILYHPDKSELGFPVDVLQLRPTTGVHWISVKPNCPKQ